jgi:methyl-accepting chemotaxis protein
LKVQQIKRKNDRLNETLQTVAGIAEETAAGVQEVNSSSQQQDVAIRKIAEQAVEINGLSQDLFAEIDQFEIEIGSDESEPEVNNEVIESISIQQNDFQEKYQLDLTTEPIDDEAILEEKKKDLVLV